MEIASLTQALVGSLDEARKELYEGMILEDATVMGAKFGGAHGVDNYLLKMENAPVMKVHARHLDSMTYQLSMEETHAEEHLELLWEAKEQFRLLFLDWIKSFDSAKRYDDGWGLFI